MRQVQTPAIAEEVTGFFDKHLRDGKRTRDDANYIVEPPDCWQDPFADEIAGLLTWNPKQGNLPVLKIRACRMK
jgi:hypothetical protein